jgi:hypothetical protein
MNGLVASLLVAAGVIGLVVLFTVLLERAA